MKNLFLVNEIPTFKYGKMMFSFKKKKIIWKQDIVIGLETLRLGTGTQCLFPLLGHDRLEVECAGIRAWALGS